MSDLDRRNFLAMAGLAALLTGCGKTSGGGAPSDEWPVREVRAEGVRRQPATGADTGPAVAGLDRFAGAFTGAVGKPGANVVLSPLSLAVLLSMVRAGAGGPTARELDTVLGLPAPALHPAMNALTAAVVTTDGPPTAPKARPENSLKAGPPEVALANELFVQRGLTFGAEFLRTLAAQYGAPVRTVDFRASGALDAINSWVRNRTADRIDRLFDRLDARTVLVAANALFFRADWQRPLLVDPQGTFTLAAGDRVGTPMLTGTGRLGYASGDGWQAVELPYAGEKYALRLVVPTAPGDPTRLLTGGTLAAAGARLQPADVQYRLPRWKTTTALDLPPVLTRLGLRSLYSGNADLRGISPDVQPGAAVHRATITVDEWGTEAAAVSGMGMETSARPVPPMQVDADRPFGYAIVHLPTGAPLFVGTVTDPTAS